MMQALANGARRLVNRRPQAPARVIAPTVPMYTTERMFTMPAPCRGDSFNFAVSVVGFWTGQGSWQNVIPAIERAEPAHRENIEKRLRRLSRGFEPDAFAVAEQRMNDELELPLTYELGLLSCRSRARVGPDDALCKHLQKQWTDGSDYEAQHVRAKRHIEHLAELRKLWGSFLEQMDDLHAAQAVRLADDPSLVGDIASEMAEKTQQTMKDLREIGDKAIGDHERLDLYDFAIRYDSALRDLMQHLDIPTTSGNGTGPMAA